MLDPKTMTHLPKTLGLRHLALNVRDVQVSKKFYCDFFGMQVEWEPDAKNIFLTSGGRDNLALHERHDLEFDYKRQPLDHLGFMMKSKADVDTFRKRAVDMNVPIAFELKQHRDGAYSFYLKDPDGYVVQVIYHPPISEAL